ncbi:hypothetical protein IGI04_034889 [Brassica rapa subsp. trilocularis]|uniref:Uncharacterized protein n=1 Tax=Brassica rapa subsp. trilocularis TaxID=1813537 RepID=A0ABQ7LA14_BRACM|nr:hypothetical protein IGI04_034889 [Brassica rapa subsp. trilocularis]
MESNLATIVEVLEEINENTSDHDPSLPSGGNTSRNVSRRRRASLFRRFLAFFCCSATTMSMSRRCRSDSIQAEDSTPQSYKPADKSSFDETILEQDKSSLHYPYSEGSDFMQSEDSTQQRSVLSNERETILDQDRRNIQSHASEGSDSMQSEDLTSQSYVTSDELSLGDTVSENISGPGSEESDTTESEDSTSQGYVTADELSLVETVSEQNRGNIPTPAYEGYDFIEYGDSASVIYVTANELTEDSFCQLPSSPQSIESTFPPQNSAPGTIKGKSPK